MKLDGPSTQMRLETPHQLPATPSVSVAAAEHADTVMISQKCVRALSLMSAGIVQLQDNYFKHLLGKVTTLLDYMSRFQDCTLIKVQKYWWHVEKSHI